MENKGINPVIKERAKQIPILEVARRLEIEVDGYNKAYCIDGHDKSTKSLTFYLKTNTYYCFGCKKTGDTIQLVMEVNKSTLPEAVNWLIGDEVCQIPRLPLKALIQSSKMSGEEFADIYEYLIKILPTVDEKHYLIKERRISLDVLVENNIKKIDEAQTWNYKDKLLECFPADRLLKSGVLSLNKNKEGYHFFFWQSCAVFPFYRNKKIIYLQGLVKPEFRDRVGKVRNLSGIEKLSFYIPVLDKEKQIYLVEGIISALTYLNFSDNSIALLSGSSVKEESIKELFPYKDQRFILVPDVDIAGKLAFEKLADLLFKNGFHYKPEMISVKEIGRQNGASEEELSNVKDVNDLRLLVRKKLL